jgi:hypothetical protein
MKKEDGMCLDVEGYLKTSFQGDSLKCQHQFEAEWIMLALRIHFAHMKLL